MKRFTPILLALPAIIVIGGCSTTAPTARETALPSAPQSSLPEPPRLWGSLPRILLEPEAGAVPAKLKDEDYHRVTGDYAYKDLEAVLRLVGRVPGVTREVTQVRFFERIAVAAMVQRTPFFPEEFLCAKDADDVWQVVGRKDYHY